MKDKENVGEIQGKYNAKYSFSALYKPAEMLCQ